jgi:hypothetical protein
VTWQADGFTGLLPSTESSAPGLRVCVARRSSGPTPSAVSLCASGSWVVLRRDGEGGSGMPTVLPGFLPPACHFRYSCVTSWRCRGDDNWVLPAVGVVRV